MNPSTRSAARGNDAVANLFDLGTGSLVEPAVVPERAAAPKPANLDFVQAASVPMVALTAWQAMKERAGQGHGQRVFFPAGAGGIGSMAIQLAKHFGAEVATTTSTGNVPLVRSLGADTVIDYTQQAFEKELRCYDMVLGTLRDAEIEKAIGVLHPGGKLVSLAGPLDVAFVKARGLNVVRKMVFWIMSRKVMRLAAARDVAYSFLFVRPDGAQLAEIGQLLQAGTIRPVVDRVFPFKEALAALAYLAKGRAKGKVVAQLR